MQLWKWALVLFSAVLFPVSLYAGDLKIDPSVPVVFSLNDPATTKITVTYYPSPADKIEASQKLTLEAGLNGKFWPNNTRTVALIRQQDGSWKATLERGAKELWLYLIFQVRNETSGKIDINNGNYWDVVFYQQDGKKHFQGVEAQADTYTGTNYDNGIARTPDFEKALSILKDEMEQDRRSQSLLLTDYWDIKVRGAKDKDSVWPDLSNEIRSFTADHRADKGALMGAFNFIQINHENLAQDLFPQTLRYIDAIDSGLSKRLERSASLNLIFDQKDSSRRAAMMGQFIRKFPTDPNILTVVGASFRYMRDSHDVIGAEKLFEGRKALEPDWADLYAGLASIYIDNNQKLDQALALLDYAEKLGPDGVHPPQRAAADYVVLGPDFGQSQAEIAYWRARAYVAQDHGDLALPFALKAEERKKNAARTFVVAQAYEAVGEKQKAVDKYFEALTMPSINSLEERERLEHLWLSGGFGSKESLEQKLREQQDETFRKANYTPRLVDRPVPEYEFTTLTNEKFTSANLHDRVVVLNMWGTWCAPCLPELPGFEALQKKHPEIFVALVAVSSEKDKINSLVARYKLGDLHIGQNEKMEDTFAASGVPVTYIIDHGRIRVIHQDSLSDVVAYLEADLNAMQKEIAQTSSSGAK